MTVRRVQVYDGEGDCVLDVGVIDQANADRLTAFLRGVTDFDVYDDAMPKGDPRSGPATLDGVTALDGGTVTPEDVAHVRRIEAEAAARQVPSYEDIATALNMYENEAQFDPWPPDEMLGKHHVGCMHVGRLHAHLFALLSAGDKDKDKDKDKAPTARLCDEKYGVLCTLDAGHDGQHVAAGPGGVVLRRWGPK